MEKETNKKVDVTMLVLPLCKNNGTYSNVWVGIPKAKNSIHIGLQKSDGYIEYGITQDNNRHHNWPSIIHAWYVAKNYVLALENCKDISLNHALLHRCSQIFLPKDWQNEEDHKIVLQLLPNGKQDIDDLLEQLPPLEYIESFVSIAQKEKIYFDLSMLRQFLRKYKDKKYDSLSKEIEVYAKQRLQLSDY